MANVRLAIDTGIAALTIKDAVGAERDDLQETVTRIQASRGIIVTSEPAVRSVRVLSRLSDQARLDR